MSIVVRTKSLLPARPSSEPATNPPPEPAPGLPWSPHHVSKTPEWPPQGLGRAGPSSLEACAVGCFHSLGPGLRSPLQRGLRRAGPSSERKRSGLRGLFSPVTATPATAVRRRVFKTGKGESVSAAPQNLTDPETGDLHNLCVL